MTPTRSAPARSSPSSSSTVRPRRYLSLWQIATTSLPIAPISPSRSIRSSCRSPTAPSPSSSRPPGRRTPFMISSSASSPASLCARSTTTVTSSTVKKFIRPGLCSASGWKVRSPSTTVARGMPTASAAEAAARVFSTLNRDSPARVIGTSTSSTSGSASPSGVSTATQPSITVVARPPAESVSRIAGESGSRENTHGWALITAAHREDPRVVGVEDRPPVLAGDPRDHRLDLGELVDGVDALQAEVVGGDVGDHRDVVAGEADALEQDAAAGRLGHRELDVLVGEHPAGAAGPRVVARLDQLSVDVDPVGVGPADQAAVGAPDVGDHPAGRGLAVGARDGDHRHPRRDGARSLTRLGPGHQLRGAGHDLVDLGRGDRVQHLGHRPTHHLRARPVAPRVGHDELVRVAGGPHPDRQPRRTALRRQRAHQPRHRARREPLPEAGVRLPRPRARRARSAARTAPRSRSAPTPAR